MSRKHKLRKSLALVIDESHPQFGQVGICEVISLNARTNEGAEKILFLNKVVRFDYYGEVNPYVKYFRTMEDIEEFVFEKYTEYMLH